MNTMVMNVENSTIRRAGIISSRCGNSTVAFMKAQQIDLLKEKLKSVAHFIFQKKNGEIREAWGTVNKSLMGEKVLGTGIRRESVGCIVYWDIEKGAFRSFRMENLIQVF